MQLTKHFSLQTFADISRETLDLITDDAIRAEMLESNTAEKNRQRYPEQFAPSKEVIVNMARTAELAEPVAELMLRLGFGWDITSGYRCSALNKDIGGASNSEHEIGCAIDVRYTSQKHALTLIIAAIESGFTRIGLGSVFIHLGCSEEHPSPAVWNYSKRYATPDWLWAHRNEFLQMIKDVAKGKPITKPVEVPAPVTVQPTPTKPVAGNSPTTKTYTVSRGQGPFQVAMAAGIPLNDLVKFNPAKFPQGLKAGTYMLHPGDKLNIEAPAQ